MKQELKLIWRESKENFKDIKNTAPNLFISNRGLEEVLKTKMQPTNDAEQVIKDCDRSENSFFIENHFDISAVIDESFLPSMEQFY